MTLQVALFGEFGHGNLGNDMSCRAAQERLAQQVPEAEFSVMVRDTGRTEQALGLPAVPFARPHGGSLPGRLWAKLVDLVVMLRVVSRFDLVVVPGTGLLEEATALLPGGHLVWLVLLSFACRARRVPLVWMGLGGSPYGHRLPAWVAAWAARGARRRSFRDTMTRDAMGRAGLDVTHDRLVHDLVLATDPRPVVPAASGGQVVVSVVNLPVDRGRARYAAVLAQAVDRLAAAGDAVTMVVMDDSDLAMTDEVLARLDGPAPLTARPADLDSLLAVLADADVVVASRYHALVGTLLAGRIPVAVAHAAKDAALLAQAGLDDYVLDIATVSADEVLAAVAAARADAGRAGPACDQVCQAARTSVGAEVAAVATLLDRVLERR
ncbi:MAG: polysaccharide pyruvyl transferase family protein [Micrococcales bacterium]|nr:polysaccharide pyruvyl transferase family protein [Micrococcales bacterium]